MADVVDPVVARYVHERSIMVAIAEEALSGQWWASRTLWLHSAEYHYTVYTLFFWMALDSPLAILAPQVRDAPQGYRCDRCGCDCYYCERHHNAGLEFCSFGHASYCALRGDARW